MNTLSKLGHIAACPGSASLPWATREGDRAPTLGRAIHALIEDTVDGSRYRGEPYDPAKLAEMFRLDADDAGPLSFLASHLRLPVPAGALSETSLGYFPDGSVRRIEGGAGSYPDVGQWLSGQLDLMWAEPFPIQVYPKVGAADELAECPHGSTLWLCDVKSGDDAHVPPIGRNWQLRGGAVMAARWTGATRVIPAIVYVNAAECAEAVREGRAYEGRWEVGEPLDAAALDKIEKDMRAVLARARGEEDDDREGWREQSRIQESDPKEDGGDGRVLHGGDAQLAGHARRQGSGHLGPLILGPHCEHCPARAACPALAREAVTLFRAWEEASDGQGREDGAGHDVGDRHGGAPGEHDRGGGSPVLRVIDHGVGDPQGRTLTPAARSRLAGILPALRKTLDAIETAVRAGGPVLLSDGREYGPVVETVRSYRTRPTYEALAAVVGDDAADEAFEATAASLKRALDGKSKTERKTFWDDLEARGAVVVTAREVWRRRYPAKPVEGGDDGEDRRAISVGEEDREGRSDGVVQADACVRARDVPQGAGEQTTQVGEVRHGYPLPREGLASCPVCSRPYTLTRGGTIRAHAQPGGGLRCHGSGKATAQS